MQARLRESYLEMGQIFSSSVSPVGIAWKHTRNLYPGIELYASDESHPSLNGSYLAACTFYSSIFHKSPVGGYYPPAIPLSDATILQQIAFHTVFDSLPVWNLDTTQVHAAFDFVAMNNTTYQFINSSLNAVAFTWDFGDGNQSHSANPIHTYSAPGNYLATLHAYRDCQSDSAAEALLVLHSDGRPIEQEHPFFFPNPCSGSIHFSPGIEDQETNCEFAIINLTGTTVLKGGIPGKGGMIDVSTLGKGIYFIRWERDQNVFFEKVVIN
jgi:hypothetical protein